MDEQKQEVGGICLARGFVLCIVQLFLRFIVVVVVVVVEDRVKVTLLLPHTTKENRGMEV